MWGRWSSRHAQEIKQATDQHNTLNNKLQDYRELKKDCEGEAVGKHVPPMWLVLAEKHEARAQEHLQALAATMRGEANLPAEAKNSTSEIVRAILLSNARIKHPVAEARHDSQPGGISTRRAEISLWNAARPRPPHVSRYPDTGPPTCEPMLARYCYLRPSRQVRGMASKQEPSNPEAAT